MKSDFNILFLEYFDKISNLQETIAPDDLLKLYALNKQAKSENDFNIKANKDGLINGFKFNARQQLKGMSQEEAKKEYIKLAKKILAQKR